jgi:dTDP-6-deoxy-L-talose 4-dehydrogenase (NAD+)
MTPRIAVTGATGFVGSHVVDELDRRGLSATLVSRAPGPQPHPSGRHRPVAMDIHEALPDAYDRIGRPTVLLHLAWDGLPHFRSLHHFERELPAHYAFLAGLVRAGLPRLLVVGTCLEYGMRCGALTEDMPAEPVLAYPFAKNALRGQLDLLKAEVPFRLVWARLFYVYGERQAPHALYSQFKAAVGRGDRSFPMSHGDQLRDFVPVADAARALVDLALDESDVGIVNVCSGRPTSVRSLVERWVEDAGSDIALDLGAFPYPTYEPLAFWGDDGKLRSAVGSIPKSTI